MPASFKQLTDYLTNLGSEVQRLDHHLLKGLIVPLSGEGLIRPTPPIEHMNGDPFSKSFSAIARNDWTRPTQSVAAWVGLTKASLIKKDAKGV